MAEAGRATTGRFARRSPAPSVPADPSAPVSTIGVSIPTAAEPAETVSVPTAAVADGAWAIQLEELERVSGALRSVAADMQRINPNLRAINFGTKQRWQDVVSAAAAKIAEVIAVSTPVKKAS